MATANETIIQLLSEKEFVIQALSIKFIMEQMVSQQKYVELFLPGSKTDFHSVFIPFGPDTEPYSPDKSSLFISPLEPAMGNIQIRRAKQVEIQFIVGIYAVKGTVSFEKVVNIQNKPCIQLSYPHELTPTPRRGLFRYQVPEALNCEATVRNDEGEETIGSLVDVHMEGLCLRAPASQFGCALNDLIYVEFTPPESNTSITLGGILCFRVSVRKRVETDTRMELFGLRMLDISHPKHLQHYVNQLAKQT